jgi:hypothetical protein
MYLDLKSILKLISYTDKVHNTLDISASYNIGHKLLVEFKCKGESTKYVLGDLDIDSKGFNVLYILYSDFKPTISEGNLYQLRGGVILSIAIEECFDKYELDYYLVPEHLDTLLDRALTAYLK